MENVSVALEVPRSVYMYNERNCMYFVSGCVVRYSQSLATPASNGVYHAASCFML